MIHDPWYKNWEKAMKEKEKEIGKLQQHLQELYHTSVSHGKISNGYLDLMNTPEKPVKVETITDPVIEALKKEFDARSLVGIKKYGTTLHENNEDDFLMELHHELMDACAYIMKLRMQRNK